VGDARRRRRNPAITKIENDERNGDEPANG
jgi:hypothetical protein